MKQFEDIYKASLKESLADGFMGGMPKARQHLSEALAAIEDASMEIREDYPVKYEKLGEIYAELKEFWANL